MIEERTPRDGPDDASRRGTRRHETATSMAAKVTALKAKAGAIPQPVMITPATAGPMKRARLKTTELIARAEARSVCRTRSGARARRAGW